MNKDNVNLKTKLLKGGAWIVFGLITTHLLNIAVMAILARKLTPSEFGLAALAMVISQFITLLALQGATQFIIYDNELGREDRIQATFWMDQLITLILVIIGILIIPIITSIYNHKELNTLLYVILLSFPIRSITKVPDALLKKNLEFKTLEIRDSIILISTSVLSVIMAIYNYGVWSLVIPPIFGALMRVIVVFKLTKWRPKMKMHFHLWPRIFRYYRNIVGDAVTTQIISEGDTLLVGKFLGTSLLGIYNLGWQSANLINRTVLGIGNKIALPSLASVSNDLKKTKSILNSIMRITAIFSFPLFIGLFVLADDFILTLYGKQWADVILPFRILLVYAIRYAVSTPIGAFFHAIGKPEINFKLGLLIVPFYLAGIYIGSYYGIIGVAIGVTLVRTFFGMVGFAITARFLNIRFIDIISPMLPALSASIIMGVIAFSMKLLFISYFNYNHFLIIFFTVIVGSITYIILLRLYFKKMAQEIVSVVSPFIGQYNSFLRIVLKAHN